MPQKKRKSFLGLVISALMWLFLIPWRIRGLYLAVKQAREDRIQASYPPPDDGEPDLPPGYDPHEQTRRMLQGFEELVGRWITSIHLIEQEYAKGPLQWRRLGLMKLTPIRKNIEGYVLEAQAGVWPQEVNGPLALAINRITKATYELMKEPPVPVVDLSARSHMVDPKDMSFKMPENTHVPNFKEKPKA